MHFIVCKLYLSKLIFFKFCPLYLHSDLGQLIYPSEPQCNKMAIIFSLQVCCDYLCMCDGGRSKYAI